jgi:hypothetical protein
MSAIASFYLVRNEDINRLKELAIQPVGRGAGGSWQDPYWEFLFGNARELEHYRWSGYIIGTEVYFYLQSRAATLDDFCDKELSDYLCQARGSSVLTFRAEAGNKVAQLIEDSWPDVAALRGFLNSPTMTSPMGDVAPIEAVFDGLRILKDWLSQIDASNVGLLTIG